MRFELARRRLLQASLGAAWGVSSSGWLPALAQQVARSPQRGRQCLLLWMSGGPSQTDTFDMKPAHRNGGEFKEVATRVPGVRFSEHLPRLAEHADQLAIVRGVTTREGDHERGTYLMRTGQRPGTPIPFPCVPSALAKELANPVLALPDYVSIHPQTLISPAAFQPGFLGPRYAAATVGSGGPEPGPADGVGFAELRIENLTVPEGVTEARGEARISLWDKLQRDFLAEKGSAAAAVAQDTVYRRALEWMRSEDLAAFDLAEEPAAVREMYGRGRFGQGCLLARRLLERGVPIVEVALGDGLAWDTHQDNFNTVRRLSDELDRGWGNLLRELRDRDLLQTTTVLWMGEFGRTPQVNERAGRDHFPNAWTCVFAGGGIRGGQYYGETSPDGTQVIDGQVNQGNLLATLCRALGVDPATENLSPEGRPHRIVTGHPIQEILL